MVKFSKQPRADARQSREGEADPVYQIGDHVVYVPEGVSAHIQGFEWTHNANNADDFAPTIRRYVLDIGITVAAQHLEPPGTPPAADGVSANQPDAGVGEPAAKGDPGYLARGPQPGSPEYEAAKHREAEAGGRPDAPR